MCIPVSITKKKGDVEFNIGSTLEVLLHGIKALCVSVVRHWDRSVWSKTKHFVERKEGDITETQFSP